MVWYCRLIVREECFELGVRKRGSVHNKEIKSKGKGRLERGPDQEFMIAVFSEMGLEPGMQDALNIKIDRFRSC